MESLSNERPFNSVKGFFQVNFKDHTGLLTFYFLEMGDHFLDNNSIVKGPSVRKETCLAITNNPSQMGSKSPSNYFFDELVLGVTQPNRPEVFQARSIKAFRNETKVSGVHLWIHYAFREGLFTKLDDFSPKTVPVFLIHKRVETIRAGGLINFKGEDGVFNLFSGGSTIKKYVNLERRDPLKEGLA